MVTEPGRAAARPPDAARVAAGRRRSGVHSSRCFLMQFSRRGERSGDRAKPGGPGPRPGRGVTRAS